MRISDWSSDVCSSDVGDHFVAVAELFEHGAVFIGALHLRTDHQEVHHRDPHDRHDQDAQAAAMGRLPGLGVGGGDQGVERIERSHLEFNSEEHTSALQSLMRISNAVFSWKTKT